MLKTYSIFIVLLINFLSFSQTNNKLLNSNSRQSEIIEEYKDYFILPRESLYLHLNKSTYLRGENLWFQGYAYNRQTQNLNLRTRNVELRVYNEEGKLRKEQLLLSNKGIFSGQIEIDSTFTDGNYYIVANTHWMKNFKEDYKHVQKFEVFDTTTRNLKTMSKNYDINILPEGGYLVNNVNGRLAIKVIDDNGLGIRYRGSILENNNKILDFESNRFGHAVVDILPKKNSIYKLKINLPHGIVIEEQIDDIKDYGIVLLVNNILEDKTIFNIKSNLENDSDYHNTNLELLIHKEGNTLNFPIQLTPDKKHTYKMISKEFLFYGVNTITLLNNGNPILERLIFNDINSIKESNKIKLQQVNSKEKDSIQFKLQFTDSLGIKDVSISVMPSKTISYRKNKNIISSLMLEPFISGYIEDADYYFTGLDKRKTAYDLDLLLLTQGWSKYNWENILNENPEIKYERRDGLTQIIEIENEVPKKVNTLMVNNETQNNMRLFDLDSSKRIVLENTYPFKGNKLSFTFIKENKKLKKPDITFSVENPFENSNFDFKDFMPSNSDERRLKSKVNKEKAYFNFKSEFQLDEVKLYAEANEFSERKYNTGILKFFDEKEKIDAKIADRYQLLSTYLNSRGYYVRDNGYNFNITDRRAGTRVYVIYGGVRLNDLSILSRSYTSEYEMIGFSRIKMGMIFSTNGSYIYLEPRNTPLENNRRPHLKQFDVINGYEVNKEYYMPKYTSFRTESFKQFGTIAWFSNLKLAHNDAAEIKIFDTGLDELTFHIEGISDDGSLINIEKTILISDLEN